MDRHARTNEFVARNTSVWRVGSRRLTAHVDSPRVAQKAAEDQWRPRVVETGGFLSTAGRDLKFPFNLEVGIHIHTYMNTNAQKTHQCANNQDYHDECASPKDFYARLTAREYGRVMAYGPYVSSTQTLMRE